MKKRAEIIAEYREAEAKAHKTMHGADVKAVAATIGKRHGISGARVLALVVQDDCTGGAG